MTQLMFEHPAEIPNALGMDPSRHRNLASIDANGTTLARMIDAKDLIDALNSSHFIFVEPLSMSTGARHRTHLILRELEHSAERADHDVVTVRIAKSKFSRAGGRIDPGLLRKRIDECSGA